MVKASNLRPEVFRFILPWALTLMLFLMLDRAVAQEGDGDLRRFADEDDRTVIYHQWRFDCGRGLGTPTTAYLYVNITGPGVEFSKYNLDFENQWSTRSPGSVDSSHMDNLQVHTKYMLMFKHTYHDSQIYPSKHTATIRVDEELFPHGYELTGHTAIEIVDNKTCRDTVHTAVPTLSPIPAALSLNSPSAATSATAPLILAFGGTAAAVMQMFLL